MDKLSPEQRHKTMAAIRGKDTKPEMIVRKGLWKRGFRYRLNSPKLPGHPDLVLRKYRTCIFVNGCFWHGHHVALPEVNSEERIVNSENSWWMELQRMVEKSVAVKQRIVTEDPTEQGIRKALNLGHTAGHAFESFALKHQPILHGYAVAYGLVCELYLSCIKTGFPTDKMHQTVNFIHEHYGKMSITCDDYPQLMELMTHDKKNVAGIINFTLLGGIGDIRINQTATKDEIYEALDFYRES